MRLVSTIISEYVFLHLFHSVFLHLYDMVQDAIRMAESTLESLNHLWRRFKLLNHDSLDAIHAAQIFNQ
jgi:hypothetical protein